MEALIYGDVDQHTEKGVERLVSVCVVFDEREDFHLTHGEIIYAIEEALRSESLRLLNESISS